jgi:hypothetical protein
LSADRDFIEPLLQAIGDLLAWFQATGVPGVIIGDVAASLQSKPRLTRNVDAVILLGERSLEDFLKAGARFGIVPRLSDPLKFARQNRILLLIHSASSVELDVSLGVMPFEEEMVSRAHGVLVQGVSIPVASPEDLIVMKALPLRDVDARDIDSLLEVYPDLDKARVRHWVRQFAEVMEMPEMIERLEMHLAPAKPRSPIRKSVRRKPRRKGKK